MSKELESIMGLLIVTFIAIGAGLSMVYLVEKGVNKKRS